MTRDGLTEENLHDGSVKDISHRSRGRPETKEEFVPERERKKAENEDTKSGKGKRLQMEKVRKSSVRQEAVEDVTLTNGSFDAVARANLNAEQLIIYNALNTTYGNRNYLWDVNNVTSGSGGNGMSYEIPPEALQDEEFARMIREAEKYLGVPYVWGGYSPSGFDCSGFVSYVINHCGNGWNYGRLTAEGLRGVCTYVSPGEAKPGDLIFFQGTYNTSGASHVGIYVGNNMMIHCGDPIHYSNISTSYWQQHFMCFGRLP